MSGVVLLERCIYCGRSFTRGPEGDHVIPAALGEFAADQRFYRVCPKCNSAIGQCEEELIRCSAEGVMRHMAGGLSRGKRGGNRRLTAGSKGCRPPEAAVVLDGHLQPADFTDDPNTTQSVDCIVAVDQAGNQKFVRIYPSMTPESLRKALTRAAVTSIRNARVHFDTAHAEDYGRLFSAAGMLISERLPDTPAGNHSVRTRITYRFTDRTLRAIAKIAFHYFLVHSPRRPTGDETCFSAIRQFITFGGDYERFFLPPTVGLPLFPKGMAPRQWCHFLFASENDRLIEVYVNLFMGPRGVRKGYWVRIGRGEFLIDAPPYAFAHRYEYAEAKHQSGNVITVPCESPLVYFPGRHCDSYGAMVAAIDSTPN